MAVKLNGTGRANAVSLIDAGKYNATASWSMSAQDENKLLGDKGDDWAEYEKWFLGLDDSENEKTKAHFKYPFGKNGKVYRAALTAIRQRAGQQDATDIFDAAGSLVDKIDKKEKGRAGITHHERGKGKLIHRAMTMDPSMYNAEEHSIPATLATNQGVDVWDPWNGLVREYLLTESAQFPPSGQIPFIDSHDRSTVKNLLGSVRNCQPGANATGDLVFSSTEADTETKAREGHLTDVSIGYDYDNYYEVDEGATGVINGREFAGPCRVVPNPQILEASAVIIGADAAAKMLRSLPEEVRATLHGRGLDELTAELHEIMQRSFNAPPKTESAENHIIKIKGDRTMPEPTNQPTPDDIRKQERDRIRAVTAEFDKTLEKFGQHESVRQLVTAAKENDMPLEEFRAKLVDAIPGSKTIDIPATGNDNFEGIREKDLQGYSLLKIVRSSMRGGRPLEGLEKEMDQHVERLAKESGISRRENATFIPATIFWPKRNSGKRELNLGDYNAAGALGKITVMGSEFIELLRNQPMVEQAGARRLDGLSGKVIFPRQTAAATAAWSSTPTDSDLTVGDVTIEPKPLTAQTIIDYTLINQTSPDVERVVQEDLLQVINIEYDRAALNGAGAAGEPLGILNIPTGLSSPVTFGAAATWAKVTSFEKALGQANALKGKLAWMTTPGVQDRWKNIPKTSTWPMFLWGEDGRPNGYPAFVTNQMPNDLVLFGNWLDLFLATFAGIQLISDPYSLAPKVKVTIAMMGDVAARHPASFCPSTDSGAQ